MKQLLLLIPIIILSYTTALAQSNEDNEINLDFALGKNQQTLTAAYLHNWSIGNRNKIIIGIGGRFTTYLGRDQYYATAPAKLTSGSTGPLVFFKKNITANMDTFLVAKPNVYALNAMINLGYQFTSKLQVGFNIDVIGISFGSQQSGNYINGDENRTVTASVTSFNALLVSDNDLGSLNSELYATYTIGDRWLLRTGAQFLFTEYTTTSKVQQLPEPNDRFRRKSLMLMIGAGFRLNK